MADEKVSDTVSDDEPAVVAGSTPVQDSEAKGDKGGSGDA